MSKQEAKGSVSIHQMVGAIALGEIAPEDRQAHFDEAVDLLYGVYPRLTETKSSLSEDWAKCRLYSSEVLALEKQYRESESPLMPRAEFATILANTAWFLFEEGSLSQSMQILPTARTVGEATMVGNEFVVSTIYRCIGGIYLDTNKAQAAFDNFNRQMQIMEDLGPDHELGVAAGLSNCALAKMLTGDFKASRAYLTRAQNIRSKHPSEAKSYAALMWDVCGILDGKEGHYDDAIKNIEAAIKLYDNELGKDNAFTAL
jgi:tetratricopeptide (TPR) repeat protein